MSNKKKKPKGGRPTLLTPELQSRIVKDLEIGTPRTTAASRAGVSYSTFKSWVQRGNDGEEPYSAFVASIKKADADAAFRNLSVIQQVAVGRVIARTTTTHKDGSTSVTEERDEPVWTAAAWFLERRYPEHFGSNRREINDLRKQLKELTSVVAQTQPTPKLDLSHMSDEQLKSLDELLTVAGKWPPPPDWARNDDQKARSDNPPLLPGADRNTQPPVPRGG